MKFPTSKKKKENPLKTIVHEADPKNLRFVCPASTCRTALNDRIDLNLILSQTSRHHVAWRLPSSPPAAVLGKSLSNKMGGRKKWQPVFFLTGQQLLLCDTESRIQSNSRFSLFPSLFFSFSCSTGATGSRHNNWPQSSPRLIELGYGSNTAL
jgi:hypothetical protein